MPIIFHIAIAVTILDIDKLLHRMFDVSWNSRETP